MALIPITEEFDSRTGEYRFMDPGDVTQIDELVARKHTDLRAFYSDVAIVPFTMFTLDLIMDEADDLDMEGLEGGHTYRPAETWSGTTTVGPDSAYSYRNTLRWSVVAGSNVTESVGPVSDLTGYAPTDSFVVSFPSFPGTSLDIPNCSITLSDATSSLTLSLAGKITATNGAQGASWPMSALGNMLNPTTVRFTFVATGSVTVVVGHIRAIAASWSPTKLDIETINQRVISIFDRDGTVPSGAFPKVWRSSEPSSSDDPLPINSRLALNFNTGNMTGTNSMTLFMRGRREDLLTQLDLDGTDDGTFGENQDSLEARGHQPDYGAAVYNPRAQVDLETMTQVELDAEIQAELERIDDLISESWIEVTLSFGTTSKVVIGTTETLTDDDRLIFDVTGLVANTDYLFTCDLTDHSMRVFVYSLLGDGTINLDSPVFDSTLISNEFLLKRRKGRIGWSFSFASGNAWVDSVRSRGLNFGEIITNNFESFTPVEGARIFVGTSPDIRIPTLVVPYGGSTTTVDRYNARSTDGSFKVQGPVLGGIQTNFNSYEDFEHTSISFDLYYPQTELDKGNFLQPALLSRRDMLIPLVLPGITGDQWQTITIRPYQAIRAQSGDYRFLLIETNTTPWWIDNLNIVQKTVAWSGRSTYEDPWNREAESWTKFLGHTNSEIDGVVFPERGFFTQIRGQALTQNATIDKIYTKPKYAELGRTVWNPTS